mmetsp:Transcript_35077/g.99800  ORF Transcript_35077/g.99800 Transcript_35077/m.99800 type:complete len:423 (+) Transcript_35077:378-1646(+)
MQVLQDRLDDIWELQQLQRQLPFGRLRDLQLGDVQLARVDPRLPLNGADSGVSVEEVHRRVALRIQHLVIVEDVVGCPVLLHVEIPNGSDAQLLGRRGLLLLVRQLRAAAVLPLLGDPGSDLFPRPGDGLVEEVHQLHCLAGPGLEALLVLPLHDPKAHVVNPRRGRAVPASLLRCVEDHVEVCLLAQVCEVDDPVAPHHKEPVVDRRHVCGVVAKAAVALHDHQRDLRHAGREDAHRALALHAQAAGLELVDERRDHLVVERLAPLLRPHAQPLVDLAEGLPAHVADLLPSLPGHDAASLQVHDSALRSALEVLVVVEALLGRLVEGVEVRDVWHLPALHEAGVRLLHVLDQHPELSAPIAHVIQPVHLVTTKFEDPAEGLAQNGRSQVADVHLLRDVRRGKVHRHALHRGIDELDLRTGG